MPEEPRPKYSSSGFTTIAVERPFAEKLRLLATANGLSQNDQLIALAGETLDAAVRDMLADKSAKFAVATAAD